MLQRHDLGVHHWCKGDQRSKLPSSPGVLLGEKPVAFACPSQGLS